MAEALVQIRNRPNAAASQRGDWVFIGEDGHEWTAMESKAVWVAGGRLGSQWSRGFIIIKIPGVPAARLQKLVEPWYDVAGNVYRKCQYFLDIDATPSQLRDKIGNDYEIAVTKEQIRHYVKRKSSGLVYDPGWD